MTYKTYALGVTKDMTNIVLNDITSGYNISKINANFDIIKESINNDVLNLSGGNNTMLQDIDVNSNSLLNVDHIDVTSININGAPVVLEQIGTLNPDTVGTAQIIDGSVTQIKLEPTYEQTLIKDAELIGDTGADLVGFTQTGVGATSTTVLNKLRRKLELLDFVNPSDVSGVLAGTIDVAPMLNKALDEVKARGADALYLPAGKLLLNTKITVALTGLQGLTIEGKGMGITQLICADPTGDGLEINCAPGNWWINVSPSNALRIANLSICSTALNLGTGLKINGGSSEGRPRAPCVLDHIEIRAKDTINNQAFLTGLWLNDCGDMHAVGCRFINGGISNTTPTAVNISATDATTDPTVFNFDHCEWYYGNIGLTSGSNPEGIYLTQCTMVGVNNGVVWTAAAESGLHVIGGHYNCKSYNFDLNGVFDFVISNTLQFLSGVSPLSMIRVRNGNSFSIVGNSFSVGNIGVELGTLPAGARGGYIGSNQFGNMTTGISLAGDSNNVTVGPNGFTSVTNRVLGVGGAGSFIQKRSWSISTVPTLVGGATSEAINIAVPTNTFLAKPTVVVATAEGSSADYVCSYNSSTSTATSIQLRIVRRDGGTITAGAARFNIVAYE